MLIFLENINLGIGNLYSRSPEENYNNKASSEIILNLDFERLLKDPKKIIIKILYLQLLI